MRRLSLRDTQLVELDLLDHFYAFCVSRGLTCYLVGGTLLGAVRHKGFIPWDDDVDVCMPRPDYERLMAYASASELSGSGRYVLEKIRGFARLYDSRTRVKRSYVEETTGGSRIWLDILPVDGLPEDEKELRRIYSAHDIWDGLLLMRMAKSFTGTTRTRAFAKTCFKPFLLLKPASYYVDKIERLGALHPYDDSDYVGVVTAGRYGPGERMAKDKFERAVVVEFEDRKFPTYSCWHEYLSGVYGDYMTPMPESGRDGHIAEAWLLEEGDEGYR